MVLYFVNHDEFQSNHQERGNGWALFVLFQQQLLIIEQLNLNAQKIHNIMATQAEVIAQLKAIAAELQKTNAETVFILAANATLTAKVTELQAIIDAGGGVGGTVTQDMVDAVKAVQDAADAQDQLIPDIKPPVANAPVINSALTATASVGQPFSYQITADGTPTSFDAAPLPDGLSVDANGLITGAPTAAGESTIGLTATNAAGVGQASLVLTVA